MPYTTVVPGTVISTVYGNANIRDQVITPFANAAARDAAITSPVRGMVAYLTDTDLLWRYNGTKWMLAMPRSAYKTSNESVSNSSTLQDDDALQIAVDANGVYIVESFVIYTCGTTEKIKVGWSAPASTTFAWAARNLDSLVTTDQGAFNAHVYTVSDTQVWAQSSAIGIHASPLGLLTTAGNAGTFKFQWAQNSAGSGTATIVYAGSWMRLTQVG